MTLTASPNVASSSSAATSPSKNISYENPLHPPGRTATRRARSVAPSAWSSSLTLTAALSVRVITVGLLGKPDVGMRLSAGHGHLAGRPVGKIAELGDDGVAEIVGEPLDEAAVHRADQRRVRLGMGAERAVGEGDDGGLVVGAVADDRVETELLMVADQRLEGGWGA